MSDSDPVEQAVAEWLDRMLAGERLDAEAFARARGLPPELLLPHLRNARWLVGRHRSAHEERGARMPTPPFRLGQDVEVVAEAGRGGMGIVFRGRQLSLGRTVAIKVLDPVRALAQPQARARFLAEAQAAARLSHANMVRVLFVGEDAGLAWFAMEWVEGESLAEILERRRLSGAPGDPRESALLAAKVARALHHTHLQGLVHRDVKPANILVDTTGEPRLSDFGLVRDLTGEGLTLTGEFLGSPPYMSPEQVRGDPSLDARSDVYSLGVTLFQCLTLRLPFQGASVSELKQQILAGTPAPPRSLHGRVPLELQWICLRAMAREPEVRFATAADLAADLEAFLRGEPIAARPPSLALHLRRAVARHGVLLGVAGVVGVVVLLLAFAWRTWDRLGSAEISGLRSRLLLLRLTEEPGTVMPQLDAAIQRYPGEPQFHMDRAVLLIMYNRLEEAEQSLRAALRLRPTDPELASLVVEMAGIRQTATPASAPAPDPEPVRFTPSAQGLLLRGALLASVGRWPDSIELLLRARELDRSLAVEDALILSYRRMGRMAEAWSELDRVMAIRQSPRMLFQRCQVAFSSGERARGDRELARLVKLAPDSAFTAAARILQLAPDPAELDACDELARVAQTRADWNQAWADVTRAQVVALQVANQPARILRLLEAALERSPRDPYFRYLMGVHLVQLGDQRRGERGAELRQRGVAALARAAADAAQLPLERDFLQGIHAFNAGDLELAIDHLRRAVELVPRDAARWRPLALALYTAAMRAADPGDRQQWLEQACEAQGREAELVPGDPRARHLLRTTLQALADEYAATGDAREAQVRKRIAELPGPDR